MRHLQNLHTHSVYCDGVDTPEVLIRTAMEKGFESLGFSGHSPMWYSPYKTVTVEKTEVYKQKISQLKEEYKTTFPIYLGLEVDMYADIDMTGYDYLIGSVHYLKLGDDYVGFDRPLDVVRNVIHTHFGGDGLAFAKAYYEAMAQLPQYGKFDIIAHFDLITKNIEAAPLFDESSTDYLRYATDAMEALRGKIPFFEVNTGAISRGYRTMPYPSVPLVKELKSRGFGAIISSDCHDARHLDLGFEEARKILEECGFTERYILTESGFEAVAL